MRRTCSWTLPWSRHWLFRVAGAIAVVSLLGLSNSFGQQPDVEVVTQNQTVSTEQKPSASIFSRFPFQLQLSSDAGYDDNVTTDDAHRQESMFINGQANLSAAIGTERSNLTLNVSEQLIYYTDATNIGDNPEVNTHFTLTAFHAVSRRLQITATLSAAYQEEPDFSANIGVTQRAGYFFTTNDVISASFQWLPNLSTVTSDTVRVVQYDSSAEDFDNRVEDTFSEQLRWNLRRITLFGEYDFVVIRYDENAVRDSNSHNLLGGFDYQVNRRISLTADGGVTYRSYDQGSSKVDPKADATLTWVLGRTSSLNWTASYGLEEPDIEEAQSRTTFRTGLELHQWLTAHIQAIASGNYIHSHNETLSGANLGLGNGEENSYNLTATLLYALNSRWGVHVTFERSGDDSDGFEGRKYTRDRYFAGFNLSF